MITASRSDIPVADRSRCDTAIASGGENGARPPPLRSTAAGIAAPLELMTWGGGAKSGLCAAENTVSAGWADTASNRAATVVAVAAAAAAVEWCARFNTSLLLLTLLLLLLLLLLLGPATFSTRPPHIPRPIPHRSTQREQSVTLVRRKSTRTQRAPWPLSLLPSDTDPRSEPERSSSVRPPPSWCITGAAAGMVVGRSIWITVRAD
jgi:hypothetical protein